MTAARERMVRVVAETLTRHRTATFGPVSPGSGWTCKCGEGGTVPMHSSAFAAHDRHAAEAVVAALEAASIHDAVEKMRSNLEMARATYSTGPIEPTGDISRAQERIDKFGRGGSVRLAGCFKEEEGEG